MEENITLTHADIKENYHTLRFVSPRAERKMEASLRRYGQMSPIVVFRDVKGEFELVDGFKRVHASRNIKEMFHLCARVLEVGVRAAKAAVLLLNWSSETVSDLEEAFVIRSLVRDDCMTQKEVALLLKHDRSWVSRRLGLAEQLSEEVHSQMRLGLVSVTIGRELAKLPRGTQENVLSVIQLNRLSTREVSALVELLLETTKDQYHQILQGPREALREWSLDPVVSSDPRLSSHANRLRKYAIIMESAATRLANGIHPQTLSRLEKTELIILSSYFSRALSAAQTTITAMNALQNHTQNTEQQDG